MGTIEVSLNTIGTYDCVDRHPSLIRTFYHAKQLVVQVGRKADEGLPAYHPASRFFSAEGTAARKIAHAVAKNGSRATQPRFRTRHMGSNIQWLASFAHTSIRRSSNAEPQRTVKVVYG